MVPAVHEAGGDVAVRGLGRQNFAPVLLRRPRVGLCGRGGLPLLGVGRAPSVGRGELPLRSSRGGRSRGSVVAIRRLLLVVVVRERVHRGQLVAVLVRPLTHRPERQARRPRRGQGLGDARGLARVRLLLRIHVLLRLRVLRRDGPGPGPAGDPRRGGRRGPRPAFSRPNRLRRF